MEVDTVTVGIVASGTGQIIWPVFEIMEAVKFAGGWLIVTVLTAEIHP